MGAADTVTVEPASPTASRSSTDHAVEPSAPPLPPSYDDVISSMHEEAGTSRVPARAHTQGEAGPFGKAPTPRPSEEHQPLIAYSPPLPGTYRDADSMSSRDFFASLEYKRTAKGYSSNDWWLNADARALRRFISECNERPRVSIEVVGSHTEERVVESINTDSRTGNERMQRMTSTSRDTVVDFRFSLELTPFIHEKGTLHMTRAPSDPEPVDIDQFLQNYVATDNVLKQLQVTKKAIWDYDTVRTEITRVIKSTGYPHSVHITFPMGNDCIKIKSNSVVSRVWRHPVTSFLCFVSCACLVGWPVERAATQKWRNKLMSDFVVLASPRDYVQRHAEFIRSQVVWSPQTLLPTIG
ncbi:hypothetical protein GGH12_003742 [Coemansia sp. RSA 1822]|nr:hypothetical protein LPJ76_003477 [Coemansia sp. RSA 638]KAJ2120326.1 hypothetical protein IW147_005183 [Coemansia sp. RSA 720]KAJ2543718.1 hypothetical protein GGF49_001800 [Coemansia sp. RSA 1853]KAJ2561762.1 hypothetical protein GGH12_003742 [Coemansia sp. RSA 1822]